MILNLKNINKNYLQGNNEISALKDISLTLEKGESVAIIGPSGSGKSTLLSLISGMDRPSSGEIVFNNSSFNNLSENELARIRSHQISIIFQEFYLIPYLTAFENVCLPLEIQNKNQNEIEEKAKTLLESLGLQERLNHRPDQLSGGEKQRVAIARAMITDPLLILADEPSGNLDGETGKKVMDLLFESVKSKKISLLLVTHNKDHALMCQKIVQINNGSIA